MTAVTTIRIEMLKFYENLYRDDTGLRDTSGWVAHYAKNYIQTVRTEDLRWFVTTTLKRIGVSNSKFLEKEYVNSIVESLKANYKYTIDEERIAFVLKSKTEMNRNDERGSWISRMFRSISNGFKRNYNHTLENLKLK